MNGYEASMVSTKLGRRAFRNLLAFMPVGFYVLPEYTQQWVWAKVWERVQAGETDPQALGVFVDQLMAEMTF
jgi:hypothetical protein